MPSRSWTSLPRRDTFRLAASISVILLVPLTVAVGQSGFPTGWEAAALWN